MTKRLNLDIEKKRAGVLVPVFAVRHAEDLGVGDTEGLRQFVQWAAGVGFSVVQILPINETSQDNSPYNAISSMALEPLTMDCRPGKIPGLSRETHGEIVARHPVGELRSGSVDYPRVRKLKHELMRAGFAQREHLSRTKKETFVKFQKAHEDWLTHYSWFRAVMEREGNELWDQWPEPIRSVKNLETWIAGIDEAERDAFLEETYYWQYVQWIVWSQWGALRDEAAGLGVAIMGDMPFGVSYYSSDVFAEPELFDLTWSGGAPPETMFKDDLFTQKWGQNWGIPLYRWDQHAATNFKWWRRRLRGVRSHAHICRIDHVLGFYRIYSFPWRPQFNGDFLNLSHEEAAACCNGKLPGFHPNSDDNPEHAAANCAAGERYLRVLLEAAEDCVLVGEDLGQVPDYVRPNLRSMGIAGFKIPMWESGYDGRVARGEDYPRESVATYATHDHPPLRQIWDDAASGDHGATQNTVRLLDFVHRLDLDRRPFTGEVHHALLEGLCTSNSWLVVFMITDLFGSKERFNVPGAVSGANWSTRIPLATADFAADAVITQITSALEPWLRSTGRTSET